MTISARKMQAGGFFATRWQRCLCCRALGLAQPENTPRRRPAIQRLCASGCIASRAAALAQRAWPLCVWWPRQLWSRGTPRPPRHGAALGAYAPCAASAALRGRLGLTRKGRHDPFAILTSGAHLDGVTLERGLLQLLEQWCQGLHVANEHDQPANITTVPVFGGQLHRRLQILGQALIHLF